MSDATYLTEEGASRLKKELEDLKGPKREALAKRLRSAIQQGDLSENADYTAAKEEQAFLEGRILELEEILHTIIIIDSQVISGDRVSIGSHIKVQEEEFPPDEYHLVGPQEADPSKGRISYESPIGKALLEHRVGDIVEVITPAGQIHLKILEIK
jgi:transcription elongation factor GreA